MKILPLTLALLMPLCICRAGAPEAETASDKAAIIAMHDQARQAHLTGNADLLASGIADRFVEARRGAVLERTREEMRLQFTEYFKRAKYSVWKDTYPPTVNISSDGKTAWMIVAIHGELVMKDSQGKAQPQSFNSSWIEVLEKINGAWKMVAISSTVSP